MNVRLVLASGAALGAIAVSAPAFAQDADAFARCIAHWPPDVQAHLAWLAAQQALRGAGLDRGRNGLSMGIVIGSSRGPLGKIAEGFKTVID